MELKKPTSFKDFYYPSVSTKSWKDYRWQLKNSVKDLDTLASILKIESKTFKRLKEFENSLYVSITPYYLSLINPKDKNDPVSKQCVPSPEEFEDVEGLTDPLGEKEKMAVNGVIHKYPDRALFLVSNICPVYCRHCFRRNEWGKSNIFKPKAEFEKMIKYVKKNASIKEVIISGGDPFLLSDSVLEFFLKRLRKISHLDVIRIASRIPVVLPQRITKSLCSILKRYSPLWLVTHFNHPNEITDEAAESIKILMESKVSVLNQTVLLKGVNDNPLTIEKLFRGLIKIGVKPYYLFQCDPAKGVAHFRTPVNTGLEIMEHLIGRVSGLAQPIFAIDTEGGGKIPLLPNYLLSVNKDTIAVKNYQGKIYKYKNPAKKNN